MRPKAGESFSRRASSSSPAHRLSFSATRPRRMERSTLDARLPPGPASAKITACLACLDMAARGLFKSSGGTTREGAGVGAGCWARRCGARLGARDSRAASSSASSSAAAATSPPVAASATTAASAAKPMAMSCWHPASIWSAGSDWSTSAAASGIWGSSASPSNACAAASTSPALAASAAVAVALAKPMAVRLASAPSYMGAGPVFLAHMPPSAAPIGCAA
mmetsp:Transcript_95088/g.245670  ORF Transcript_95088/g.245670 Transcript_95088/m.245670 type:complete len:222 (+) Transcript_95088:344-1009(+)